MPYVDLSRYINFEEYYRRELPDPEGKLSGDEYVCRCPFHDDKKASFSANVKDGRWYCFSEGEGGTFVQFYAKKHGMNPKGAEDKSAAFKMICKEFNIPRDAGNESTSGKQGRERPKTKKIDPGPAPENLDELVIPGEVWEKTLKLPAADRAWYKSERGWTAEAIDKLDLRLQTLYRDKKTGEIRTAYKKERVAIPIRDSKGNLRNIRLYHPKPGPKYPKVISWGESYGRARNFPAAPLDASPEVPVYLCEGEPDTICAVSMGLNAITHTGKPDVYDNELLEPFINRDVIICYDLDEPGEKYAIKSARNLFSKVRSLKILRWPDFMGRLPDGKAPKRGGQDLTDFFIKHRQTVAGFHALTKIDFTADDKQKVETEEKAATKPECMSANQAIELLNNRHAGVMVGGRFCILNIPQDDRSQISISFSSVQDFRNRYANFKASVPTQAGFVDMPVAPIWLECPERREYPGGVVFSPGKEVPGCYNLFRGFAVEPREGDWHLFKNFIFDVVCSQVQDHFNYVLGWMAKLVQDPGGERPGTSIVVRGPQGIGKGTFVHGFGMIFGCHYAAVSQPSHVAGRFNGHMADKLLIFVDEGFWAGDKAAEGVIKSLISEPHQMVEAKGKDAVRVENHVNLIIASNNSWVVPAGLEERRFFVLDASASHKQDNEYFAEIHKELRSGGREAMLFDLLGHDLSAVNLRKIPRTKGLFEQILSSMSTVHKFWFEALKAGVLQGGENPWPDWMNSDFLFASYLEFCKQQNDRYPLAHTRFFIELRKICPGLEKDRRRTTAGRLSGWRVPDLEHCREEFSSLVGMTVDWDDFEVAVDQEKIPF